MAESVAVIGAGSWGTALAAVVAGKGLPTRLWALEPEVAKGINVRHENTLYLAGIPLPAAIAATTDIEEAVAGATVILCVSPAQHVRQVIRHAGSSLADDALVISASKGIEKGTLLTMAGVLGEALPAAFRGQTAFVSGPSFAVEVARGMATAVTVASDDADAAIRAQTLLQTSYLRVYTSSDVAGVELGGALKNVMALATGMAVGLGLGHNARAAIITRGLAEMARLGTALGAKPITFSGLAGMGDLILTCTGELSRNRHVGVELGKGKTLREILDAMTMVAEGVDTTIAAHALALREGIEMPIIAAVHAVLFEGSTAQEALDTLMLREPKPEFWS